jgi:hypothetical protein
LSVAKKTSDDEAENKEAGHWLEVADVGKLDSATPEVFARRQSLRGGSAYSQKIDDVLNSLLQNNRKSVKLLQG